MKPGTIVLIVFGLTIISLLSSYIKKFFDYLFGKICIIHEGVEICVDSSNFKNEKQLLLKRLSSKINGFLNIIRLQEQINPSIKRLFKRLGNKGITRIEEIIPTTSTYHYTENNGKKLKLCLGKTQKIEYKEDIIDFNTLFFITLHELAHTMTLEEGHTKEFYDNFKYLITEAIKFKIYKSENYKNTRRTYCGIPLTENPIYN
tara:strand:- start:19572 stop:20180 length:609 start_codon:yes stop_codon:yes gene_type:complete